jgi:hypothetical protein
MVLMLFVNVSYSQISVSSNGSVTLLNDLNINPYYQNSEVIPKTNGGSYLGSHWYRFAGVYCSTLYYSGGFLGSDKRLKNNFRTIDNPLSKVLNLTGRKYDLIPENSDLLGSEKDKLKKAAIKKDRLGFVAQEMEAILPEAVFYDTEADQYYIEYTAIIPVIVEAMKEQEAKIEALEKEIESLIKAPKEKSASLDKTTQAYLNQNIPNPFSVNTCIEMVIPNIVSRATLYIYNMQGEQIKQITINERGNTSVIIEGHTLKAGMYLYTLITDGKEADTKKMILTR